MLEIRGKILGRRKGRIDLSRMLQQSVSHLQSASFLVRIGVRGPPLGFQRLDGLTRSIDKLPDVLGLHCSKDIMRARCVDADFF